MRLFNDFTLSGAGFAGGAHLAAGDVNGDGFADLVFGSGAYNASKVKVLSGKSLVQTGAQTVLAEFAPAGSAFTNGVRVGVRDVNGDGVTDVVTGAGSGRGTRVAVYSGKGLSNNPTPFLGFDVSPGTSSGVFVG